MNHLRTLHDIAVWSCLPEGMHAQLYIEDGGYRVYVFRDGDEGHGSAFICPSELDPDDRRAFVELVIRRIDCAAESLRRKPVFRIGTHDHVKRMKVQP